MNKYESVILINQNITEDERKELISKFKNFLCNNGKVNKIEEIGLRKLAYEVQKQKEAYYVVYNFETSKENIAELERLYRITDEIIKFIVIRIDE